jgi:hypothetical protein
MARAVLGGELRQVDLGRVHEPERLGYGEWPVNESAFGREQLDPHTRPGELVQGEQGLEPATPPPAMTTSSGGSALSITAMLTRYSSSSLGSSTRPYLWGRISTYRAIYAVLPPEVPLWSLIGLLEAKL